MNMVRRDLPHQSQRSAAPSGPPRAGLAPQARPGAAPQSRTLFWRVNAAGINQRAVRDGSWKLVIEGNPRHMLFDVSTDPGERDDVAAANTAVVRRLYQQLQAWEKDAVPMETYAAGSAGPEGWLPG